MTIDWELQLPRFYAASNENLVKLQALRWRCVSLSGWRKKKLKQSIMPRLIFKKLYTLLFKFTRSSYFVENFTS
jgi:hypothetical protein